MTRTIDCENWLYYYTQRAAVAAAAAAAASLFTRDLFSTDLHYQLVMLRRVLWKRVSSGKCLSRQIALCVCVCVPPP